MWRKAGHHLFTFVSACSLIAAVLCVVLWWRSYGVIDAVVGTGGGRFDVKSWRGQVMVTFTLRQGLPDALAWRSMPAARTHLGDQPLDAGYRARAFGFAYQADTFGRGRRRWTEVALAAPHWFVMAGMLVCPAWWLTRVVRRRGKVGRCPRCGYDLRASGERCPECGAAVGGGSLPNRGVALRAYRYADP